MFRNSIIALATVAALVGVAAPAMASPAISLNNEPNLETRATYEAVVDRLEAQGLDVTNVESWGGKVRAFVTLEDGTQVQQFFNSDTLAPVSALSIS